MVAGRIGQEVSALRRALHKLLCDEKERQCEMIPADSFAAYGFGVLMYSLSIFLWVMVIGFVIDICRGKKPADDKKKEGAE